MIKFDFNPRKFLISLLIVLGVLILINIIVLILAHGTMPDSGAAKLLERYFNFATEANVPTYYNTILIFLAAQSFYLLAKRDTSLDKAIRTYLFTLTGVFVFLSIDELAGIHEWFSYGLPEHLGIGGEGIFKFAWIIPYGIVLIVFGLYSLKFLKSLELSRTIKYIGAGALYLMGVFVMEALGGWFVDKNNGIETLSYYLYFTTPEETFEMLAMIWIIHTNLVVVTKEVKS